MSETHTPWNDGPPRPAMYRRTATQSQYLTMPDGVRIAVDVTLPLGHRGALPTVVRQTRYHRRMDLRPPFDRPPLRQLFDQQFEARRYFVTRGYAWVDVCARGSGASGGERPSPWAEGERKDGGRILDWIGRQAWSNGAVGARGISYDGTAAEFLMWQHHPALRAVAPRFSLFDAFEDVAMPGGIHLEQFTRNWASFNDALDRNSFGDVIGLILGLSVGGRRQLGLGSQGDRSDSFATWLMQFDGASSKVIERFVRGVAAVDGDPKGEVLFQHLAERKPALDVFRAAQRMTYRDDRGMSDSDPELGIDDFSPHAMLGSLERTVPMFHYTGWFDGAYQRAAIKRFHAHDDAKHRLIIGPWEHGGRQNVSPFEASRVSLFDHEAELIRFFDAYLLNDEVARLTWEGTPRVRYYTIGAERWQTDDVWPPASVSARRFHLGTGGQLSNTRAPDPGVDRLDVAGRHGTGLASRWRSLLPLLALTHYEARPALDALAYTSGPLERDTEVTGHPLVHVVLSSTTADPRLFAYIEDVDLAGVARYVTEGQLRALHRRLKRAKPASHAGLPYRSFERRDGLPTPPGEELQLEFDLLPTSYLFRRGHRIRLVLAGTDADHFDVGPLGYHEIRTAKSWIDLPIVP